MSKCLVLSVFTSDFDHLTIPAVFHWANFVSVKFLSNYRILFKETRKTFFCLLIVWRIGEKIGHSWKKKSILGPGRVIILVYHKNLTKFFEWPDSVEQAEEPLGHLCSGKPTKNSKWWEASWDQFNAESPCSGRIIFSVLFPFYTPEFVSGMGRSGLFLNMMSANPMWINMYFIARLWGETDEWKTKISWLAEEPAVLSHSKQVELLHFLSKS